MSAITAAIAHGQLNFDTANATGRPTSDPKVPGAMGMRPTYPPVARKVATWLLESMARFYMPASKFVKVLLAATICNHTTF